MEYKKIIFHKQYFKHLNPMYFIKRAVIQGTLKSRISKIHEKPLNEGAPLSFQSINDLQLVG